MSSSPRLLPLALLLALLAPSLLCATAPTRSFSFGPGSVSEGGALQVLPGNAFARDIGFGFEAGAADLVGIVGTDGRGSLVSAKGFTFTVRVPREGNYRITLTLGNATHASVTTVKAELRRLMVENCATAAGESRTVSFTVNTRTPHIPEVPGIPSGEVRLKAPREVTTEAWAWDDALTLEFCGTHPSVSSLTLAPVDTPTLYLIGDSTVCDQSREPYASWGQMLPRFLSPDLSVANHAESGETYRDSIGRRRLDKILSLLRPGDYLLMQFGHNDQKQLAQGSGGPFTTYKDELRRHVVGARACGAIPVVISPMERRRFDAQGRVVPSLADYAEASRQVALEEKVAFVDLNALSKPLYEWLEARGADYSRKAFAGKDDTHHNNYGAYELAKCVAAGLLQHKLPLQGSLLPEVATYTPAKPDDPEVFAVPASSLYTNQRPLGD